MILGIYLLFIFLYKPFKYHQIFMVNSKPLASSKLLASNLNKIRLYLILSVMLAMIITILIFV